MKSDKTDTDDNVNRRFIRQKDISFDARAERQVATAAGQRIADHTDDDCRDKSLGELEQLRLLGAREHRHQTDLTLQHTVNQLVPQP